MNTSTPILNYGAGGLGVELLDLCGRTVCYQGREIFFVDDFKFGSVLLGFPIISLNQASKDFPGAEMILASGDPEGRVKMFNAAKSSGFRLPTVIDDTASVSFNACVGEATIICARSILAARSQVGSNVLVNVHSIIGHDVFVDDAAVLASMVNTGGGCRIGKRAMLGMGVTLRPGISIGKNTTVALGSTVFSDVPNDVTVVGNPARVSRKK